MNYESPKRGEREGNRKLIKRKNENYPNLGKDFHIQVHETNRSPQDFNPRQSSLRYIKIKLCKQSKNRILKAAKEKKNCLIQGTPNKAISEFLSRIPTGQEIAECILNVLGTREGKNQKTTNQEYFIQQSSLS